MKTLLLIHKLLVGNRFPPKMFFKAINAHYLLQYRLIPHLPDEQSTLLKGIQSLSFPLTQSLLVESFWRSVSSSNYPPTRKFGDLVIIKEMTKEVECEDERDQVKQEYQWSEYVLNQDSMLGRGPHVRLKNEPPFITILNFFSICTAHDAPHHEFLSEFKTNQLVVPTTDRGPICGPFLTDSETQRLAGKCVQHPSYEPGPDWANHSESDRPASVARARVT